ncbi:hypothetical protein M514_00703 [Trichuris suis]|uniref:Histidine acid phosphatase n=1 Tax=Trichuris suis TaxID=68888 RepID=A0A085N6L0_9BILA|nr:hypothetical protein M513_00703 [Trichuris suis]KFD65106.1 hypothetical protein M514_00703 [Trichuris suis]
MGFIQRVIFLLIAVGRVSSDIESNKTMQPEDISSTNCDAFCYTKLALQSLLAKLTDFAKQIQSLLSSALLRSEPTVNATELRLVAAVWRHGSRAPVSNFLQFPNDQIAVHWPRGLGELTKKGIEEQRLLGEFLRERYKEFMTNYSSETIYVRSSDSKRTIASGLVTISGFISRTPLPTSDDIFSLNQTIPIYTTPLEYDSTLDVTYANCPPPYRPFIAKIAKSSNEKSVSQVNTKLLQLLEYQLGRKLKSIELFLLAETIICYYYDEKVSLLPLWMRMPLLHGKVKKSYAKALFAQQLNPETQRLRGSNLFKEIADRFVKKAKEGEANKLQFLGYSTHDMTLLALLADWGVSTPSLYPDFSSCIMVELHERDSDHYVEIWYRPGHGKKLVQLKVTGCGEPCKLQEFVAIAEKYASVNITADCEKFKEQGLKFVNQKLT